MVFAITPVSLKKHESTRIKTNRTFLTARNRLIAYAPKRACALAVGSGERIDLIARADCEGTSDRAPALR